MCSQWYESLIWSSFTPVWTVVEDILKKVASRIGPTVAMDKQGKFLAGKAACDNKPRKQPFHLMPWPDQVEISDMEPNKCYSVQNVQVKWPEKLRPSEEIFLARKRWFLWKGSGQFESLPLAASQGEAFVQHSFCWSSFLWLLLLCWVLSNYSLFIWLSRQRSNF